jgi:DNA-binding MarR family transcriptional regulator
MSDRKLTRKSIVHGADPPALRGRGNGHATAELGALNGHLGYFARRLQVWIFQDFIRTLAPVRIRPAQFSVLVVIGANAGLSQADLSQALGIERARLVRLLDKLERRGLTERRPSPRDRRSHALFLTREGQKLLKRAESLARLHEAKLTAKLGAGRHDQMLASLREFSRGLES